MSPADGVLHPFLHLDGAKLRRVFHPCKRSPTWRGPVSGLPCSRAVPTCVHARMRIEGNAEHLPSRGPGDGVSTPFLLPNWKKFATQLGRNFSPVRQQRDPVLCPERSVRSAFRRCDLECKTPILSTNQPFLYANSESTSRARDILVFINAKFHCFSLIISSPGLKTG